MTDYHKKTKKELIGELKACKKECSRLAANKTYDWKIKTDVWIMKSSLNVKSSLNLKRIWSGNLSYLPRVGDIVFVKEGLCGETIESVYFDLCNDRAEIRLKGDDKENFYQKVESIL